MPLLPAPTFGRLPDQFQQDQFSTLTDGPFRCNVQIVRGLVRLLVVGFTVVSLMLVGVVGVSATSTSGKAESAKAFNSVVALVSNPFDQTGAHNGTTGTTDTKNAKDNGKDNGKDKDKDKDKGDQCKDKHPNGTPGREHHHCDADHDSD